MRGELVHQGAEARIYYLEYLGYQAVRKERFVKTYRHPLLDERLTKSRIKAEAKAMSHLKSQSPLLSAAMPTFLAVCDNQLVMTRVVDSQILHEVILSEIEKANNRLEKHFDRLGLVIAEVHRQGIIHGDLTTSNFLLKADGETLIPIDFGLSSFSKSIEDRAVDLYVLERSLLTSGHDLTHLFDLLLVRYQKEMDDKEGPSVIKKLEEVRSRGRKRDMTG